MIGVDPATGRPAVALDGIVLDDAGGWQAAVDAGFAQVADVSARLGEPIAVVVVDTASDWNGRFLVQPDRSIAEDVSQPPTRRRRGPLLALLAAAAVLVIGSAVVVSTQLTSAEQPLAPGTAAAPPTTPTPAPEPPAASPAEPSAVPSAEPTTPPPSSTPAPVPTTVPPAASPPVGGSAQARGPQSPRGPEASPRPRTSKPAPTPRPAPKPVPKPAPPPNPQPVQQPAAAPPGVPGRIIDGRGTCLGATGTTLASGSCLPNRPDQMWSLSADGLLRTAGGCLTAAGQQALAIQPCRPGDTTQVWRTGSRVIVNAGSGRCALVRPAGGGAPVAATVVCRSGPDPMAQFVSTSS